MELAFLEQFAQILGMLGGLLRLMELISEAINKWLCEQGGKGHGANTTG